MATTGVYIDIIGFCVVADAVGNKQIVSRRRGPASACADFAAMWSAHRLLCRLASCRARSPQVFAVSIRLNSYSWTVYRSHDALEAVSHWRPAQ